MNDGRWELSWCGWTAKLASIEGEREGGRGNGKQKDMVCCISFENYTANK